jgi:uncharacterized membrane protein
MHDPLAPSALPSPSILGIDTKVVLLALGTAVLTTAGLFFQKLNGVRAGGMLVSGWLVLAVTCFLPTFFITNKAFQLGGRMSLYVPVTAAQYILTILAGRFYFSEAVSWDKWLGCGLILIGVAAIAR